MYTLRLKKVNLFVKNQSFNRNNSHQFTFLSTRGRARTGTAITGHRILSPACLPIPPLGRGIFVVHAAKVMHFVISKKYKCALGLIPSGNVQRNLRVLVKTSVYEIHYNSTVSRLHASIKRSIL